MTSGRFWTKVVNRKRWAYSLFGLAARVGENCVRHWEALGYDVDEVHAEQIVGTASWLVEAVGWRDEAKSLLSAVVEPEGADWVIVDFDPDADPFRGL